LFKNCQTLLRSSDKKKYPYASETEQEYRGAFIGKAFFNKCSLNLNEYFVRLNYEQQRFMRPESEF
jgi:hypothetical protein